ncbi:MAG: hypothetical protein HY287_13855 [Planctomycetes bacterium]|nr:hypothetical protein [Planctomycetota bacterium]MBI3835406.1 hypothetical protein [Planctomycetota bacterium]
MQLTGELRAPDAEYNRIVRDLAIIRQANSLLATVIDDPSFVPSQLMVQLVPSAPTDGYQALNQYYQVVSDHVISQTLNIHVLTFCDNIYAPTLATLYGTLPEVDNAEPNFVFGTDDQITIVRNGSDWQYSIEDGFTDCFDGCDCSRTWVFNMTDFGQLTFVNYSEFGPWSWCAFEQSACCINGTCEMLPAPACAIFGHTPFGAGIACDGDSDGDGLEAGCGDFCPSDPNMTQPLLCGCGRTETCDAAIPIPAVSTWTAIVLGILLLITGCAIKCRRMTGMTR